jgi:thiol-disulfide isomerase/thioredoxin
MRSNLRTLALLLVLAFMILPLGAVFAGTSPNQPADDFSLQAASGGQTISLSKQKGNPTLVVFWATWCPPCRREIPTLKDLHKKYGPKGLQVLAIALNYRETRDDVVRFQKEYELPYTVLWDEGNAVADKYGVSGIPTVVLVDPDGVIRYRGNQIDDSMLALLDKYTASK